MAISVVLCVLRVLNWGALSRSTLNTQTTPPPETNMVPCRSVLDFNATGAVEQFVFQESATFEM